MDAFPLLTLPPETLHKLLNRFQLGELFQLSQCSQKASNTVKTYSSSFDKPPVELSVTAGPKHDVKMYRSDYSSCLDFTFYGERDPKRVNFRFPKTYNCDGQLIDFCGEGPGPWSSFGCTTPHSTADFLKFALHFKTLFNANLCDLYLTIDDESLKATLMSEWLLKSQSLSIRPGGVTYEEMLQILEYFNGIKNLELACSPGQYFSYDKTISTNELTVNGAIWIKRHNLLKLDCEYVHMYGSHLENEDLNAFLRHWLKSGDKKLKCMTIRGMYYSQYSQEKVLKGLPTLPGASKRRDVVGAFHYLRSIPFETGMDLRRKSDGVLATVVVQDDCTFTFIVWQEPNPNSAP